MINCKIESIHPAPLSRRNVLVVQLDESKFQLTTQNGSPLVDVLKQCKPSGLFSATHAHSQGIDMAQRPNGPVQKRDNWRGKL